jgi:outer membrane protein OmpA-like peptidoglycan-associated protein
MGIMKILVLLAGALALAGMGGTGVLAAAPNGSTAIVVAQGDDEGPGDEGMGDEGPGDEGPGDEGPGDEGPGDEGPGAGSGNDTGDNPDVVPDSEDMDAAEAEVREQLRNARVEIRRRGNRLIVNMGADILFSFDSYEVSNEGTAAARALSRFMEKRRRATVEINGHTDTRGSHQYNETLSANRARAVADIMVEAGVDPGRIRATGYGETRPAVQTGDEVKEIRNRRVEVVINPGQRHGPRPHPRRHRRHRGG